MIRTRWILLVLFGSLLWTSLGACSQEDPAIQNEMQVGDFDYAAGNRSFQVALNGVVLQINQVDVLPGDTNVAAGYVYVVPRINVTNQSETPVTATEFMLVDEYLNQYKSWQTNVSFYENLTPMPAAIVNGDALAGDHVFIVPAAALQSNLKVRWESSNHQSRIEISLGNLAVAP